MAMTSDFTRSNKNLILKVRGKKAPPHLLHLRIPPAWTNVQIDPDPSAKCVATGIDIKGRLQRIYSKDHVANSTSDKFSRIDALLNEMDKIETRILKDLKKTPPSKQRDAIWVSLLIFRTGIRPGSNADTLADKKAYGATTLQAKHVKPSPTGNSLRLKFIGKKGVPQNIPVNDKQLVDEITKRKRTASGYSKRIFNVSSSLVNAYISSLGNYTAKDFRTMRGTHLAFQLLGTRKYFPKSKTKLKKLVNDALDKVAKMLGNTRAVSKKSYVNPVIIENILNRGHPKDV